MVSGKRKMGRGHPRDFSGGDERVLQMDRADGHAALQGPYCHGTGHLTRVQVMHFISYIYAYFSSFLLFFNKIKKIFKIFCGPRKGAVVFSDSHTPAAQGG